MKRFAIRLMSDDSGQDLIEYALLAGFISLVAVVATKQTKTRGGNVDQNGETATKTTGSTRQATGRLHRPGPLGWATGSGQDHPRNCEESRAG